MASFCAVIRSGGENQRTLWDAGQAGGGMWCMGRAACRRTREGEGRVRDGCGGGLHSRSVSRQPSAVSRERRRARQRRGQQAAAWPMSYRGPLQDEVNADVDGEATIRLSEAAGIAAHVRRPDGVNASLAAMAGTCDVECGQSVIITQSITQSVRPFAVCV